MKNLICALICGLFAMSAVAQESTEIYGFTTNQDGITFQVPSHGCTTKENFKVLIRETIPLQVGLEQVAADDCEAYLPYGTTLTYTWTELGLSRGSSFFVFNSLKTIVID